MVLSNIEIHRALDDGRLIIAPEPVPRKSVDRTKCPYDTTAVDLRLGNEIAVLNPKDPFRLLDLRSGEYGKIAALSTETIPNTAQQPYHLKPNQFVLGKTLELVELPILPKKKCLSARIEGKSSFARCGLLIHLTAPTIHAGFRGTITLELANLGPFEIVLYPGMYICQLILEEVGGTPFRNDSRFQGQTHPTGAHS